MRPKYLVVAQLHRPHGLGGEIEASSLTDFPERLKKGAKLYPSPPVVGVSFLVIERVEQKPQGLYIKFEGIDNRNDVEKLVGHALTIPIEEAAELPEGEFWVHDIIGMEVYTTDGDFIGVVQEVLRTGSNDVYVVTDTREYLIPAIEDVISEVSLQNRRITIRPIPGLLE